MSGELTVTVTTSAGSDGAVVVFIDTGDTMRAEGGPGVRVLLNDEPIFAEVDWAPAEEKES